MSDLQKQPQWQQFEIPAGLAGTRLDIAVTNFFDVSRASLQRWIEEGLVRVNGKPQKKRYAVEKGDLISVRPEPPPPSQVQAEPMEFDVLFEDHALFVINKPPGLVVHPAPGNRTGTFVNGLVACCTDLECQDPIRPGLVHRLDKDTSGVLIAAKTMPVLSSLSLQFHDRRVQKEYLAIVAGKCREKMECRGPIGRDPKNRQRMAIVPGGKEAFTEFFPMHASEEWTFVKAVPHTGRTHQIRVHLMSLGIPILGDTLYGKCDVHSKARAPRQMLHCASISFVHPTTGCPLTIRAPLPNDMRSILGKNYESDCPACS